MLSTDQRVIFDSPLQNITLQHIHHYLAEQHGLFIQPLYADDITIEIFPTLNSTNTYLKNLLQQDGIHLPRVCIAEQQTQGKTSKMDRSWFSPAGQNIYLSYAMALNSSANPLQGLSLVVALAIIATLKKLGISQTLLAKWPNDVYFDGKKLSGILVELETRQTAVVHTIIGIGINVNMDTAEEIVITKPWTSVQRISGVAHNRNKMIAMLLQQLWEDLALLQQHGLTYFLPRWVEHDFLYHKMIAIKTADHVVSGMAVGINHRGQLLLQSTDGNVSAYTVGEISLL